MRKLEDNTGLVVAYLPVNQAWAVLLGDTIVAIGDECRRLFPSRPELVARLHEQGLIVDGDEVTI